MYVKFKPNFPTFWQLSLSITGYIYTANCDGKVRSIHETRFEKHAIAARSSIHIVNDKNAIACSSRTSLRGYSMLDHGWRYEEFTFSLIVSFIYNKRKTPSINLENILYVSSRYYRHIESFKVAQNFEVLKNLKIFNSFACNLQSTSALIFHVLRDHRSVYRYKHTCENIFIT